MNRCLGALLLVLILAGCTSAGVTASTKVVAPATSATPVSSAARILAWWSGPTQVAFDAWSADLAKIAHAGTAGDETALGAACSALGTDAAAFGIYLPAPDDMLTQQLTKASGYATQAAADCASQDYATATQQISLMNSSIGAATARIKVLSGQ